MLVSLFIAVPLVGVLAGYVHLTYFPNLGMPAEEHPALVLARTEGKVQYFAR